MSCEVAALPFQAHANYGTWSIDFVLFRPVGRFSRGFNQRDIGLFSIAPH